MITMSILRQGKSERGFSLIEIIVAIIIMSIISIGLIEFITNSASGYTQSAARNQVSASGRIVIDRIAMELHNALPESVRIFPEENPRTTTNSDYFSGDQCLEFVPVRAATTYVDPAFRPEARKTAFDVVDFVPEQDGAIGVYAVIYPTSSDDIYAASFEAGATEAIARVNVTDQDDPNLVVGDRGTDGVNEVVTNYDNLIPYNHRFKRRSSVERLFLTDEPVSYCVTGNKLYRYSNYGFHATQLVPVRPNGSCASADCLPLITPNRVLITDQIDNSTLVGGATGQAFDQFDASRRRNAVIQLELNFSQDGQQVRLNHEILQQSTP